MRDLPFFSVITVVRNAEFEIERTLQSIIGQDHESVEFIVIDGASTDGTTEIIRRYLDRIDFFISEPDQGLYNAMNKGLSLAHGKFAIFMNAGDVFASLDVLSKVFSIVKGKDIVFMYGDYIRVSDRGATQVIPSRSIKKIWYGMFASHQSMFYQIGFLRHEGLRYDESYKIAADYKLTTEVIKRAGKSRVEKMPLCISRFELGGVSTLNMDLGLSEADRVRLEVMGMSVSRCMVIHYLLLFARILRENEAFKSIYSLLRY